jgi:hypothetical protein
MEIAARGVEADASPSEERGRRRRGGRTATATGGGRRWPPRERMETGKKARTRERREAAASVG